MTKINFKSDVSSGTFESLPEGRYVVEVSEAELRETKTGGDMITARLKVMGGDHDGRLLFDNFVIGEKSTWKLKTFLEAAGSDIAESDGIELEDVPELMIGLTVSVFSEPDITNTGNPSNKLSKYTAVDADTSPIATVKDGAFK